MPSNVLIVPARSASNRRPSGDHASAVAKSAATNAANLGEAWGDTTVGVALVWVGPDELHAERVSRASAPIVGLGEVRAT